MGLNYYASAPTLVLGPSQPGNIFNNPQHVQSDQVMGGMLPRRKRLQARFPAPPSQNYLARADTNVAGRKRSRDDLDTCDDPVDERVATPNPDFASKPAVAPVHDTAMAVVHEPALLRNDVPRPELVSRKSQRLHRDVDAGSHTPTVEHAPETDEIDQLSITLGIGWKRLSPHLVAASKGWERYIMNHYPLGTASILLFSEALNAYLVRTVLQSPLNDASSPYERFYLFKEDLSCAQLVGINPEQAIQSLTHKEVGSDGTVLQHVITRGETIRATPRASPVIVPSPATPVASETAEFEMEM